MRAETNSPSVSIDHNDIPNLTSMAQEVVGQPVGTLVDLTIAERARAGLRAPGLYNTFPFWKLLSIVGKYFMNR